MKMTKSRFALLVVFLFLAGIGLEADLGGLKKLDYTFESAQATIANVGLLCLIWLPLIYLAYRLAKKLEVSPYVLGLAIFGGLTISSHLGSSGNSLIDILNSNFIKDPKVFNDWTNALTAPFAEEFFKAVVAFMVLGVLGLKDIRSLFVAGMGSGLGFQIIEDTWFVASDSTSGSISGLSTAIDRISGGIGSHSAYTAIVVVGAYILLTNVFKERRALGWWLLLGPVVNHFFWNSPFSTTNHDANIVVAILFTNSVLMFLQAYFFVLESKKEPVPEQI